MTTSAPHARSTVQNSPAIPKPPEIGVSVVTGGIDRPYVFGLTMALVGQNIRLDVVGSDTLERPEMHTTAGLRFLNLQPDAPMGSNRARRALAVAAFYGRLLLYIVTSESKVFHILWNNKLQLLDRTLLMLFYKTCGKKLAFTAHNVNAGKRDNTDSCLNRLTLKIQYRLFDHIFVHTEPMKAELVSDFGVRESAVTVIPFGINNSVPDTVSPRRKPGEDSESERTNGRSCFSGVSGPYKGLEVLVDAFRQAACKGVDRLIIAGNPKAGSEEYLRKSGT